MDIKTTLIDFLEMGYTLFFDMDGVLADFEGTIEHHFRDVLDSIPHDKEGLRDYSNAQWDEVVAQRMYAKFTPLPLTEFVKKLVSNPKYKESIYLLTATGSKESENIRDQKLEWVRKYIPQMNPDNVLTTKKSSEKAGYSSPTSVLIDDRNASIDPWINAGGVGVLFKDINSFQVLNQSNHTPLEEGLAFGGVSFPSGGNIVMVMGGVGSGKGFFIKHWFDIEAKTLDVDEIKEKLVSLFGKGSERVTDMFTEFGINTDGSFDEIMKNPDNTTKLHKLARHYKLDKLQMKNMLDSLKRNHNTPNIILDKTGGETYHIKHLKMLAKYGHYEPSKIHLVWIVTPVLEASRENEKRSRVVAHSILLGIHRKVRALARQLVTLEQDNAKFVDGDVWIIFNSQENKDFIAHRKDDNNVKYVTKGNAMSSFRIKKAGHPISESDLEKFSTEIMNKIDSYTNISDITI